MAKATAVMTKEQAAAQVATLAQQAQDLDVFGKGAKFDKAIQAAQIVQQLGDVLDTPQIKDAIMALQGSKLGFRTDADKTGGYKWEDIKPAIMEALVFGVSAVGNQFNVIRGAMYVTKEGFFAKLADIPGLDYNIIPGAVTLANKQGRLQVKVQASYKGTPIEQMLPIVVRADSEDQAIGKATRRARKWLYERITGCDVPDGDVDGAVDVTATVTDAELPKLQVRKPTRDPFEVLVDRGVPEDIASKYLEHMEHEDALRLAAMTDDQLVADCSAWEDGR